MAWLMTAFIFIVCPQGTYRHLFFFSEFDIVYFFVCEQTCWLADLSLSLSTASAVDIWTFTRLEGTLHDGLAMAKDLTCTNSV